MCVILFAMDKLISFIIIIIVFAISVVDCQMYCIKDVVTSKVVWETYSRFSTETYREWGWRLSKKTRWRIMPSKRTVKKTFIDKVKYCCDGYIQTEDLSGSSEIQCQPVCTPACKNGFCQSPGECICNHGYVPSPEDPRSCIPSCLSISCEHGTCTKPNYCECNFGYAMVNNRCQPICTEPCYNATCIAPDSCECLTGFRKSFDNNCEPYCSSGCENGICVEPETCRCNPGYFMTTNSSFTTPSCKPICFEPCSNGVCVAPNTCNCSAGYEKSENGTCIPYCSNGCENGTCVEPEKCLCDSGWRTDDTTNKCEPICSDCGNGTCVAPDTCECFFGYKWNMSCVPECSEGCTGGQCISPGECQCETEWNYENGTCKPICKYECGNGSCSSPNTCECFSGYKRGNISKTLLNGPLCIPSCINCNGICIAPNTCVIEGTTTIKNHVSLDYNYDYDYYEDTTYHDQLPDLDKPNEMPDKTTTIITPTSNGNVAEKMSWIRQHWSIITFPVLFTMIIIIAIFIIWKWKSLQQYLKRDLYEVQGDNSDLHGTSSFVDVSFSNLKNQDHFADHD